MSRPTLRIYNFLWMIVTGKLGTALWRLKMYRLGLDLSMVELDELGLSPDIAKDHHTSGGPRLNRILKKLAIAPGDKVMDLGSGKGGAIITLSRHFAQADGVDLAPKMVEIARENLRKARVTNARIFFGNAADFTDLDDYSHIFLSNPFPACVVRSVLQHAMESLQRRPRKLTLIYFIPAEEAVVMDMGLKKVREFPHREHAVTVYEFPASRYAATLAS